MCIIAIAIGAPVLFVLVWSCLVFYLNLALPEEQD
jgi:hypothetical protein